MPNFSTNVLLHIVILYNHKSFIEIKKIYAGVVLQPKLMQ